MKPSAPADATGRGGFRLTATTRKAMFSETSPHNGPNHPAVSTPGVVDLNHLLVDNAHTFVCEVSTGNGLLRPGDLLLCDASRNAAPGEVGIDRRTGGVSTAETGDEALAAVTFALLNLRGCGRGLLP